MKNAKKNSQQKSKIYECKMRSTKSVIEEIKIKIGSLNNELIDLGKKYNCSNGLGIRGITNL